MVTVDNIRNEAARYIYRKGNFSNPPASLRIICQAAEQWERDGANIATLSRYFIADTTGKFAFPFLNKLLRQHRKTQNTKQKDQ